MFANAAFSPPSCCRLGRPRACASVLGRPRQRLFGELQRGHQLEKDRHQVRIECLARLLPQQQQRQVAGHPLAVGAVARDRIEVVRHREDTGTERDVLAAQAERVPRAVPALVVTKDERRDGIRERHVLDDLESDLRVDLDLPEFLVGERTRFRKDVLGHGQVAHVVEQRRRRNALDLVVGHADGVRQRPRQPLHAADMTARRPVLRVDRERQRLDRRQVQARKPAVAGGRHGARAGTPVAGPPGCCRQRCQDSPHNELAADNQGRAKDRCRERRGVGQACDALPHRFPGDPQGENVRSRSPGFHCPALQQDGCRTLPATTLCYVSN